MISLNDYLYSGDSVLKILQRYYADLKEEARITRNDMDMLHCNFLLRQMELLEHNDFLTSQSQRIREFYKYMTGEYPFLAFTFKGRIKSLIRSEQKFNGKIVELVSEYYKENGNIDISKVLPVNNVAKSLLSKKAFDPVIKILNRSSA